MQQWTLTDVCQLLHHIHSIPLLQASKHNVEPMFLTCRTPCASTRQRRTLTAGEALLLAKEQLAALCAKRAAEKKIMDYIVKEWGVEIGDPLPTNLLVAKVVMQAVCVLFYFYLQKTCSAVVSSCAGMWFQICRTQAGCSINTAGHVEGWHSSLKGWPFLLMRVHPPESAATC